MAYVLGIDIGTSACKTALFDREGRAVAEASAPYPLYHPQPGFAEQQPEDFWRGVCTAVRACLTRSGVNPREICGIGVDGQSWSAIPVDREGNVLAPDPIWMDTRAAALCASLPEKTKEAAFALDGNPLTANYVTGKVLWFRENCPGLLEKTHKILQSEGYINFRLTGNMTQNTSEGYGWHCFDIASLQWDTAAAEALGIPPSLLPDLYAGHEVIGAVTARAAEETGLAPCTPVVAGAVDAACAPLGVGVIHPGETQDQGGQSGGMSICTDHPIKDPRLILCPHCVPGRWLLQGGTVGGGGVVRWLEQQFGRFEAEHAAEAGKSVPAQFDDEAATVSPGSDGLIFLPYMAGERTPIWDPAAKGVYYGVDFAKTRAHFLRASMEGVCYSLRHNIDVAREAGARIDLLYATGGSANSRFWTQMKSDMLGVPMPVCASDNATNLGAAILAGVGTGLWADFDEAVRMTVREKRRHEPTPGMRERYEENYRKYLELYERLKPMMHA